KQSYAATLTREPGGTKLAEQIRRLLLYETMNAWTELFLYEAARSEHVEKKIKPALLQGRIVLCDRFTDSSLAYQGYARKLPWKTVKALNQLATQNLRPDLCILLDLPPKLGLRRAQVQTRFEKEGSGFQEKVNQGYLKIFKEEKSRFLKLNVKNKTPKELINIIIGYLNDKKKLNINNK
ncbi:MAG: dTMP kinase, partial [Deltaproteobacteria bacterium]|nr:dTMP kinase [Deltaproteobacteria bacterium]